LIARLLADQRNRERARIVLIATEAELREAAGSAGVSDAFRHWPEGVHAVGSRGAGESVPRGEVSEAAGRRALGDLEDALELCRTGEVQGILFAPLNKGALHLAGMTAHDELRWFADRLGYDGFTSELNVIPGLVTSRVTSHVSVREVAEGISREGVNDAIRLLDETIRGLGVDRPRLAVCALNPHAGEGGRFGDEEIVHITPGIESARSAGIDVSGPYPCDTIFLRARAGDFDGVVTMYHDQGQIAMKLIGFDQGVTVEGGLPIPIATPAHGTAHDIVGRGIADIGATQHAFDLLVSLVGRRAEDTAAGTAA